MVNPNGPLDIKIERIERLLRALDCADGKEDFVIHRSEAVRYIKKELQYRKEHPEAAEEDLTQEELEMSLRSLNIGPPVFKRKTNLEILEALIAAKGGPVAVETVDSGPLAPDAQVTQAL